MNYDKMFAKISSWAIKVGVTWHSKKDGTQILKSKKTGRIVRVM